MSKILDIAKKLAKTEIVDLDILSKFEKIMSNVAAKQKEISDARTKYNREKDRLNNELKVIQNTCSHEVRSYEGDPSGGSDSCHRCDICGYEDVREYRRS